MWVGCSSRSTLMSIEVKPKTPLVCWPVWVEKFSTGNAKKARYATEWPSISSSFGRDSLGTCRLYSDGLTPPGGPESPPTLAR
jgi:hypothetical protein